MFMLFANVVAFATFGLAQTPEPRTFGLLQDRRRDYDFVPYTAAQRTRVAQTVLNLMQVYVNRESKIVNYGSVRPDIDPIPKVRSVLSRAANLTDLQFHYELTDIFTPLRDFHTLYLMPGPHSCINVFKAVDFTLTEQNGREQVVVKEFSTFPDVIRLSPQSTQIAIGDEVLSVDNVPIQQYLQSRLFLAGGANEFGGKRAVLSRMSVRPGSIDKVPTENSTTFVMRRFSDGQQYTVTLPWIAASRDACFTAARNLAAQIRGGTPISAIPRVAEAPKEARIENEFENPRLRVKKAAFKENQATIDVIRADDIIDYTVYQPQTRNLGIIFLKSFVPTDSNVQRILGVIRSLLTNQLRNTNAVVFDIRENGGGIITLAEIIPQLFRRGIVTLQSRALNNAFNRRIFTSPRYGRDQWTTAINQTPASNQYTNLVRFTPNSQANTNPPVYTKPVAIFNDANCYSSCDLFSAMFQDNQVGPVFGEDGRSGAGYFILTLVVPM
jgi:hypothetical protein